MNKVTQITPKRRAVAYPAKTLGKPQKEKINFAAATASLFQTDAAGQRVRRLPHYRELPKYHQIPKSLRTEFAGQLKESHLYELYNVEFVRALAREIMKKLSATDAPVLEIAAGDGLLSRSLATEGINIHAVDDGSGGPLGSNVQKIDAREWLCSSALKPEIILASWLPFGSNLGLFALEQPSVAHFIHIGYPLSCGDLRIYDTRPGWRLLHTPQISVFAKGCFDYLEAKRRSTVDWFERYRNPLCPLAD